MFLYYKRHHVSVTYTLVDHNVSVAVFKRKCIAYLFFGKINLFRVNLKINICIAG